MNAIVVDIGNSSLKMALFRNGIISERATQARPISGAIGYPGWTELFAGIDREATEAVGFASVVPSMRESLRAFLEPWGCPLIEVSASSPVPFAIDYETPSTLGADRLAAAIGSWNRFAAEGRHIIVVDAGTAVNYELVTSDGFYRGGPIAPGLHAMHDSLIGGAAQLPEVDLSVPAPFVFNSTATALQSGIVLGFADAVQAMVTRLRRYANAHSKDDPQADNSDSFVVLTGGDARLLLNAGLQVNRIEPDIVLAGIFDTIKANLDAANKDG